MIRFRLTFIALILIAMGCATAPEEKAATKSALDERLLQKSKQMNVSVHGILENDLKGQPCSQAVAKVKAKWSWKDAVAAANSCFKSRDMEAVEALGQDLCTKDTSTPWGPYFLARVALQRNQLDRALWMVELSEKRAPDFGVIHYLAGQILWERKEFKEATAEFEKSVSFDQGLGPAHLILGQVYLRDQEYDKAAPQFNLALKYLPDNIVALSGQAESLLHLNNPSGALDSYVKLSELDSGDGQYWTRIGALYEGALNNPERALNAYQRLHDLVKAGKIKKNIDPDNDSKIKELEALLTKNRSVASEKKTAQKGEGQ
jgi:tetratricopeptide (TPR) repeat protein